MKPISARIKEISRVLKIPISHIEKDIEASNGTLQKALQRKSDIKAGWLEKIVRHYNISPEWLLTGKGEMKVQGNFDSAAIASKTKQIPIIDIKAAAGYALEIENLKVNPQYPTLTIELPQFRNGNLVMMKINGDSMEPTISHNDWVICRKLENPNLEVKSGSVYIVITRSSENGEAVCKRIFIQDKNRQKLAIQSDNSIYPSYSENVENILHVWKVEYLMSSNLENEAMNFPRRLTNLENGIAEIKQILRA